MLRAVTGMTTAGTAVEVDGAAGAIWLKDYLGGVGRLYACKNDSPGVVRTYMGAAGWMREYLQLIQVQVTQSLHGAHNLLESNERTQSMSQYD